MPRPVVNTIFPAVPKTVWLPGDPDLEWQAGAAQGGHWRVDKQASLALRGPHIDLDSGLYGVEFQLSLVDNHISPEAPVATVQVTAADGDIVLAESAVLAAQLTQHFAGMYQGVRPDLLIESPIEDIEFRIIGLGHCPFIVRGIKLIPRPGQIWFAADLDCQPADWEFAANRSARALAPTLLSGPGISLPPGNYRLGYKLKPPAGITTGEVAALDVVGIPADNTAGDAPREHIMSRQLVTVEQLLAHGGVPDAKLRFRLDRPYRALQFRLEVLSAGLTVQWLRCATADEATWHHYYHLGGSASPLGHPLSAFLPAETILGGGQGFQRHFEYGAMYYTEEAGPCEVYGAMYEQYQVLGGPSGDLGLPINRPIALADSTSPPGIMQSFEHGEMTWFKDGRPQAVEVIRRKG